jgi:hypothetical protein
VDVYDEFEQLVKDFPRHLFTAANSSAPANRRWMSIAQVGFAMHGDAEWWSTRHEAIISREVAASEEAGDSPVVALFQALAVGNLLGAYARGLLDDTAYRQGWILLQGVVVRHRHTIEAAASPPTQA